MGVPATPPHPGSKVLLPRPRSRLRVVHTAISTAPLLHSIDWSGSVRRGERPEPIALEIGARGLTQRHLTRCIQCPPYLARLFSSLRLDGPTTRRPHGSDGNWEAAPELKDPRHSRLEIMTRFPCRHFYALMFGSVRGYLPRHGQFNDWDGIAHCRSLGPHCNLHIKDFPHRLPHCHGFPWWMSPAGFCGCSMLVSLRDSLPPHGRCRSAVRNRPPPLGFIYGYAEKIARPSIVLSISTPIRNGLKSLLFCMAGTGFCPVTNARLAREAGAACFALYNRRDPRPRSRARVRITRCTMR